MKTNDTHDFSSSNWVERFDTWVRKRSWLVLLVLASLIISSLITTSRFLWDSWGLYNNAFLWRGQEYERIASLNGGQNIGRIEELLGSALFVRANSDGSLIEKTFKKRGYWVQAIHDRVGITQFIAITSCEADFNPAFDGPPGSAVLNKSTLASVSRWDPSHLRYFKRGATAPGYFFDEYDRGNPGLYKTYLYGLVESCPRLGSTGEELSFDRYHASDSPAVKAFRSRAVINTYAETNIFAGLRGIESLVEPFSIGPDHLLIRTLAK